MRIRSMSAVALLGALLFSSFPALAQAQPPPTYPPPPPETPGPSCGFVVSGSGVIEVRADGTIVIRFQGTIVVSGGPGRAPPNGLVRIDAQSHRFALTNLFRARADGSFRSPQIRLPAHLAPGPHTLFIVRHDRDGNFSSECVQPILIVDGAAAAAPRARDDRKLPFTGWNILGLLMWALGLVGVGTMLRVASRRGMRGLLPARISGGRNLPPALPPPDVPFVDTSGFTPIRPRRDTSRTDDPITEADAGTPPGTDWTRE